MRKWLPFLLCLCLFAACQTDSKTNSATNESAQAQASLFVCEAIDNEIMPLYMVYATMGEQREKLVEINVCEAIEKADYSQYGIPAMASEAVGGWFAGGGDYLYALADEGQTTIYQGAMGEMQLTHFYGYVPIAHIKDGQFSKVENGTVSEMEQVMGLYALGGHHASWLMLVDRVNDQWKISFGEIEGMLPSLDDLLMDFDNFELQAVSDFVFDPTTRSFTSSIGAGSFQGTIHELSVTLIDQKSHIEDQLKLSKIGI